MAGELAIEKTNGTALAAPTPMRLIQIALEQGADVEKLEKLMAMNFQWEANEARKAFVVALTAFKANPPEIMKNKHVKAGNMEYDHATLDHVVSNIGKGLSKHGISHRWKTSQDNGKIRVACILTHELGHSEETVLESAADTSGAKNSIQAIGSAVTYLQRYTLLAATGLAAKGQDDDGKTEGLSTENIEDFLLNIRDAVSPDELQKRFAEAYQTAGKVNDKQAQAEFIKAKDNRRREFHA